MIADPIMRTFLTVISLVLVTNCFSQRHRVTKIWETDTILAVPESVCPDLKKQLLVGEYGAWRSIDLHSEGDFQQNGVLSEDRMVQLMEKKG